MQELEVTFSRAAQIWWAWFWRATLFALLIGAAIGFVVGFIAAILGFHPQQIAPITVSLGAIVGIVVSIWVQSKILKKKFSSFRIVLVQE